MGRMVREKILGIIFLVLLADGWVSVIKFHL